MPLNVNGYNNLFCTLTLKKGKESRRYLHAMDGLNPIPSAKATNLLF